MGGAGIMENPTWKFIFFAAILFQIALSAPPGPPMDFESGWEEGPRSAAGNNEDLATLITNFLGGQGSSGSNHQVNSGHHNHGWETIPDPDPPTPTEAYNPVPVAEEPVVEPDLPEMVTDVTIGCRLATPVQPVANGNCGSCLKDSAGLCVCPRTQLDCSDAENTKQCVWLDTTKPDEPKSGKCIHKTEAIYNALYKKLSSRGKKSLALSIYYHSKPAQGRAPYGPHGPYIIDAVGHYLQKGYGARSYGSYQTPSYGGYDSYSSYDSYYGQPSYGGYESDYGYDSYKPPSYGYDSYKPPYNEYEKPYEKPYEPKYEPKPYNDYETPHYDSYEPYDHYP